MTEVPTSAATRMTRADPSPFGANVHVAPDTLLERLASAGVRWVRIDVDWDTTEPRRGVYEWGELDRVVATSRRLGMSVLASIAYSPEWASADRWRTGAPRDVGTWTDFVRAVTARYRDQFAGVSMWNEPNLRQFYTGSRDTYLRDILRHGLEMARDVAPNLVRVGPELSSSPSGGDPLGKWLAPVLDIAGDLLDVISHHQYDGHDTVAGRVEALDRLKEFLDRRGAKQPIWITEIGWNMVDPAAADLQATLLRGVFAAMKGRDWWAKTFWYDSHGSGWGMCEPDTSPRRGEPRPALKAYETVVVGWQQDRPPQLDADDAFTIVERAYLAILGRPADPAGMQAYTTLLLSTGEISDLCRSLFESNEFRSRRAHLNPEDLVRALYSGILDRLPDDDGAQETLVAVRAGRLAHRAAAMFESAEFKERFLTQNL